MRLDELDKRMGRRLPQRPIAPRDGFAGDFLVLGARTRLAKVGAPVDEAGSPHCSAAAHGTLGPCVLAAARPTRGRDMADGEKPLALTHLALSGLAKLAHPKEDARRLFLADALIEAGVEPSDIVKALGLGPAPPEALEKYNPDQPRVPAGNTDGGQWTSGDSSGATAGSTTKKPSGVQVADASDTRGHEVTTDATSRGDTLPTVDAAYQGKYHDLLRDQFAEDLSNAGNTVLKEVPLTFQSDPPVTAVVDIMLRTPVGDVYAIEVKTGEDPQFTPAQQIVYPHVEIGNMVASDDARIPSLAFTRNVVLPAIPVIVLYTQGLGSPMLTYPLWQYMRK